MVGSKADVCRGASAGARLALAIALVAVACSAPAPSYHTDVRRIIDGRCAHCHYDGGLGPLALTTYDEVFAAREPIRSAVVSGTMPPWRGTLSAKKQRDVLAYIRASFVPPSNEETDQ